MPKSARLATLILAGVTAGVAAGAALTGCTGPRNTINATSAARQITDQLTARYHPTHVAVTCPAGVGAKTGRHFVCQATIDGQEVAMDAVVTSTSGHFSVTPAQPIIVVATVASQLETEIAQQVGVRPAVHCPTQVLLVVPVGQTFQCSATFPAQAPRAVTVKIVDSNGDFGFQLAAAGGAPG